MLLAFVMTGIPHHHAMAQGVAGLPPAGARLELSAAFEPPILKGMKFHPDEPLRLEFVLDQGDADLPASETSRIAARLIKYFLAGLTVPEDELWVNLSPYEEGRITSEAFGITQMGRDLVAQDYILKQVTASLIYPEGEVGRIFWGKVYAEASRRYGSTDIPVDAFNKVWIVPQQAEVFEKENAVYVTQARLKLMLDSDYLAGSKAGVVSDVSALSSDPIHDIAKDIMREVVLPVIEKEVNEGEHFAHLRQIYSSLILAAWFRDKVKDGVLEKVYVDQQKTAGIDIADKTEKNRIWAQYTEAFKMGAYNYIKEEIDPVTREMLPKKYFSGGIIFKRKGLITFSPVLKISRIDRSQRIDLRLEPQLPDGAVSDGYRQFEEWFRNVPGERLKDKVVVLDMLEGLISSIDPKQPLEVRQSALEGLEALISAGYLDKDDIEQRGLISFIVERAKDPDKRAHRAYAAVLKAFVVQGFISSQQVRESGLMSILLQYLGDDRPWDSCRAAVDVLLALGAGGLMPLDMWPTQQVFDRLAKFLQLDLYSENISRSGAQMIIDLMHAGLFDRQRVIQQMSSDDMDISGQLLDVLSVDRLGDDVRGAAEILVVLAAEGLLDKDMIIEGIKKDNVVETLLTEMMADSYMADTLVILVSSELIDKEDLIEALHEPRMIRALKNKWNKIGTTYQSSEYLKTWIVLLKAGLFSLEKLDAAFVMPMLLSILDGRQLASLRKPLVELLGVLSVEVSLSAEKRGRLDLENIVLKGLDPKASWDDRRLKAEALSLMAGSLEDRESIVRIIQESRTVEVLFNDIDNGSWRNPAPPMAFMGLLSGGFIGRKEVNDQRAVDRLLNEMQVSSKRDIQEAVLQALLMLIDKGYASKEEIMGRIENLLDKFLEDLIAPDQDTIGRTDVQLIGMFVEHGLASREDVQRRLRDKNALRVVVKRILQGASEHPAQKDIVALNILLAKGFVPMTDGLTHGELGGLFRQIHGREMPMEGFRHYYLKIMSMLKDDPRAAYQMSSWRPAELAELLWMFRGLNRGVAFDDVHHAKASGEEYYLERQALKAIAPLLEHPQEGLSRFKKSLSEALRGSSVKLAFKVDEMSSVHATRGLLKALGLGPDEALILYADDIKEERAREFFKGYEIENYRAELRPGNVIVYFFDKRRNVVKPGGDAWHASLSNIPLKYNLPLRVESDVERYKELMNVAPNRRVIVLGSPSVGVTGSSEFDRFMKSYDSLYGARAYEQRPLLIVGFRETGSEESLRALPALAGQAVEIRSDAKDPDWPDMNNKNVLLLNTVGELLPLYALADTAVVGSDRNIFEPASQGAPILYFDGNWANNQEAKDSLTEAGAAQVFSPEALKMLLNNADERQRVSRIGTELVEENRKWIDIEAREFILQLIGVSPELRARFISELGKADAAALNDEGKGGIDLRRDTMTLDVRGIQGKQPRPDPGAALAGRWRDIIGFSPVILKLETIGDLQGFLGVR